MFPLDHFSAGKTPSNTFKGSVYETLDYPKQFVTQQIYDTIIKLSDENGVIYKSKFNPMSLGRHITSLYLVEHLPNEDDYIIRVFGSKAIEIIGFDTTGEKVKSIPAVAWRKKVYDEILSKKQPVVSHHILGHPDSIHRLVEGIYFPLCDKKGTPSHILGAFDLISGNANEILPSEYLEHIRCELS